MTVATLIDLLKEYRKEHGSDAEVRIMTQQNWPFENRICGLTSSREMNETSDDLDDAEDVADDDVIFIVEGGQLGYGSKRAWETARDC